MKIEHHHLSLQVGQLAKHPTVIRQRDINESGRCHLSGLQHLTLVVLDDSHILHTLDGNVMQVGSAFSLWVVSVPTGGHGGVNFYVFGTRAWIKNQQTAVPNVDGLEKSEIRRCLHRLLVDVVHLHFVLIGLYHLLQAVVDGLRIQVQILGNILNLLLQCHLHQREFLNFRAVLRPRHLVL